MDNSRLSFALLAFVLLISSQFRMQAQSTNISFSEQGTHVFASFPPYSAYTTLFDANGLPYVYAAAAELGLIVFDISDPSDIQVVQSIPPASFQGLKVMNLHQQGENLYLSLGGFAGISQLSGLAVVSLANPANPEILDMWASEDYSHGAPVVFSDGNIAYVGAMESGVLIFDVSEPDNIQFLSQIIPYPNFPEPPAFFSQPAARGLNLRNDTLFVCYDAKGFRLVDVSNPSQPVELSMHMNTELHATARPAYNEVVLVGPYAYVSVDYCGLEVIDLSGDEPETIFWYNPWECSPVNWACSPGHTNQFRLSGDSLLFVSGADTEVLVFSLSNPAEPEHIATYGVPENQSVTWGIGLRDNQLALAFVHMQQNCGGIVPYSSNWGGMSILEWQSEIVTGLDGQSAESLHCFPNPSPDFFVVELPESWLSAEVEVWSMHGTRVYSSTQLAQQITIDASQWPSGMYIVRAFNQNSPEKTVVSKWVKR